MWEYIQKECQKLQAELHRRVADESCAEHYGETAFLKKQKAIEEECRKLYEEFFKPLTVK